MQVQAGRLGGYQAYRISIQKAYQTGAALSCHEARGRLALPMAALSDITGNCVLGKIATANARAS